jgi:replicative DNA helicase
MLRRGDRVFGADGCPAHVVQSAEPQPRVSPLEITFSTGERVTTSALHPWATTTFDERVHDPDAASGPGRRPKHVERALPAAHVHSTKAIAESLTLGGSPNHAVRISPAVRMPSVAVPHAPYDVGTAIALRGLGQGRTAGRDHTTIAIPIRYLRGSEHQRRELLRGLLDKGGCPGQGGAVVFSTLAPHLAWDVHELACSLGYSPAVRVGSVLGVRTGPADSFDVAFFPDRGVFTSIRRNRIVEERARVSVRTMDRLNYRYVVSIRRLERCAMRTIRVDTADGRFLITRSYITAYDCAIARRRP